jgi:hypothetical protein
MPGDFAVGDTSVGFGPTWEDCFERADLLCKGRNYDVYTRPGEESPLIAAEPQYLRDNPTTTRSMVIACKRS